MSLSSIVQFILGVILGLSLLTASGVAAGYYFLSRMAVVPDRPTFPEERKSSPSPTPPKETAKTSSKTDPKLPSDSQSKESPAPGTYRAKVIWEDGLSLRDEPSFDANRIGSLAYNDEVIVLKKSDDEEWERVRIPDDNQEGWVKAGNTEKIE